MEKNGSPTAQFDVNKRTEFRVTVLASRKCGQINPECGQIKTISDENCEDNPKNEPESGQIKHESGQINPEDGQINDVKGYNTDSLDNAVLTLVRERPGIKLEGIFLEVKTSTRSVRRSLDRLKLSDKIEYRGSKKTGGWYVRT